MKKSSSGYNDGQRIDCPYCGQRGTVQIKNVLDGFSLVESYPVCCLCKHRLYAASSEDTAHISSKTVFSALFSDDAEDVTSTDVTEEVRSILSDGESHFCKDCRNFVPHPFVNRCSLNNRPVDSMDDCPRYEHIRPSDTPKQTSENAQ